MSLLMHLSSLAVWLMQLAGLLHYRFDAAQQEIRASRALKVYAALMLALAAGIVVHSVVWRYSYYHGVHNVLVETIDTVLLLSVRLTHIVTVLEALAKWRQAELFCRKCQDVAAIFERHLNVPFDVDKTLRQLLRPLAYWTVTYVGAMGFVMAVKWLSPDPHILEYWYAYVPPLFVCAIRYYQVHAAIAFIQQHFDMLIALLHNINLTGQQQQQQQQPPSIIKATKAAFIIMTEQPYWPPHAHWGGERAQLRQLLHLRDIYNRLWELSTLVNACFGISLLINVGNDFIFLTSNAYWIFLNFGHYTRNVHGALQLAAIAAISLPHLFNVVMLALACERAVQVTTGVALGLHRIEVDISNENNNALIEQFSLQLLHQKLSFTAAGFFKIDCSLLYTIVGATTTYLIILIQFYVSDGNKLLRN